MTESGKNHEIIAENNREPIFGLLRAVADSRAADSLGDVISGSTHFRWPDPPIRARPVQQLKIPANETSINKKSAGLESNMVASECSQEQIDDYMVARRPAENLRWPDPPKLNPTT